MTAGKVILSSMNWESCWPPVFEAHGLVQNWATPKLSGISSCSSLKWTFLGYPHFRTNLYLHDFFEKRTCVCHRTWEKQMTPCIPFASPKKTAPKIPIQSPLGPVFFGQGARLFLESGFLFLTEVLWRLWIQWLGGRDSPQNSHKPSTNWPWLKASYRYYSFWDVLSMSRIYKYNINEFIWINWVAVIPKIH